MPRLDPFVEDGLGVLPADIMTAVVDSAVPGLGERPQDSGLAGAIESCPHQHWKAISQEAKSLCQSGLWLLAGDLDRSHEISQRNQSAEGSFWHGIMHRREGDFGNSKYWFRRVGEHPLFDQLRDLTNGVYEDPYDFTDACSLAVTEGGEAEQRCMLAQWVEWQALMIRCLTERSLV